MIHGVMVFGDRAAYLDSPNLTMTVVVVVERISTGTVIACRKGFPTTVAGRPKESIGTVVTDSEALAAFRCSLDEAIAAVPFSTIHGNVDEVIFEFETQLELASDEGRFVAAVARIPLDEPRYLFVQD